MALTLVSLIIWLFHPAQLWIYIAMIFLFVNMTIPAFFRPFSVVWFGLSTLMGTFMSKVLLTLIFYLVVSPIGNLQRLLGKSRLNIKQWGVSSQSVFVDRDKLFQTEDIKYPF